MSKLEQLKVFVSERLTAAAEEIFGAVERTILEYHNDVCLSQDGKHGVLLRLAEGLKQEEVEVFTAVCQEVRMPEAEASTQPSHSEYCQVLVREASGPGLPHPLEQWSSRDEGTQKCLLEDDALTYKQSVESSSCCQIQTVAGGEGDLSGTSTEWIKTEEEADDCEGLDISQPLSAGSRDGDDAMEPSSNMKKHTNQKPFGYMLRGESFHPRSSLMMHVKSHADNAAILCPSNHAGNGIEPVETDGEDNMCNTCGKTFSRKSNLKRHMLIHTGQKPHSCKECGKRFARDGCLRTHMRIHRVERPYACSVCGRKFRQRGTMVRHMRTHTGGKANRCSVCSRPFTKKEDVIQHMSIHVTQT